MNGTGLCRTTAVAAAILSLLSGPAAAQLRAGAARADVTPPIGGPLYGYGARGDAVSTGVHDPLYARALVLDDGRTRVALVTLDLGTILEESTTAVETRVRERAGVQSVLLSASHTHSAPFPAPDFPSAEEPWVREAERRIADAVIEAAARLEPASVGVGRGEVHEGHNRRRVEADGSVTMLWRNRERAPTSPVDRQLAVVRVERADGTPIATLVNFACHPVVLGPENLRISADYPGALTRLVEERLGGQAMFLQGAAGDINPYWDKTPPDEGAFEEVERMGAALAAETIRVSDAIEPLASATPLSFHRDRIALAHRDDALRRETAFEAQLNTLLVGPELAIAAFPGEFFVEHGLELKSRSRIRHTLFVGYTNQRLRYFPTIRAATEGGYGAGRYGESSATQVEVGAGERLVDRALVNLYYQAGLIVP